MEKRYDWGTWLKEWNDLLLERLDRADLPYYPSNVKKAVKAKWLGFDAASEAEVQALEAHLGKKLPPSYRQFLLTSNGFLQPGMLVPQLYPSDEVERFTEVEKESLDFWLKWQADDKARQWVNDTSYFLQHVLALIVISEEEESGTARYFLNPERINEDGEWEAYFYAHWQPGAIRFDSFWELMQRELMIRRDYLD